MASYKTQGGFKIIWILRFEGHNIINIGKNFNSWGKSGYHSHPYDDIWRKFYHNVHTRGGLFLFFRKINDTLAEHSKKGIQ